MQGIKRPWSRASQHFSIDVINAVMTGADKLVFILFPVITVNRDEYRSESKLPLPLPVSGRPRLIELNLFSFIWKKEIG